MMQTEVLIVGAGPAGAVTALNLAPSRDVLIVERRVTATPRIGEALIPAARRLLRDMGLLDAFEAPHQPYFSRLSAWGAASPQREDFLSYRDGHGWLLCRASFDAWLRAEAQARGAQLMTPADVKSVRREGEGWSAEIEMPGGRVSVRARFLIDATGKKAVIGRRLRARRMVLDRTVCGWVYGAARPDGDGAGCTFIESEADGWWYTAPLPGGRRVLAFHTDSDLTAARVAASAAQLLHRSDSTVTMRAILEDCGFQPSDDTGFTGAQSTVLKPCAGDGWLAAGDAAFSMDPLSSRGLFNSLYTGLAAALTADAHLSGSASAIPEYLEMAVRIHGAYGKDLTAAYAMEARWQDQPFWRRRSSPSAGISA